MTANVGTEILQRLEKKLTAQDRQGMDDVDLKQLSEQLWRWHDEALRELLKRGHVVPRKK